MEPLVAPAAGDHVDHATDRAGAIQRGHGAANNLDPLDVRQRVDTEVERAGGLGRVVDRHAVAQHQHVVGIRAAHEEAGLPAGPAGRHHAHAGDVRQRVDQGVEAVLLDHLPRHHRHARGDAVDLGGDARGGHHDVGLGDRQFVRGECRDSQGCCQQRDETAHVWSSIDSESTARLRVSPRCIGAPRPMRARGLDSGRSPGYRVLASARLLIPCVREQWRNGPTLSGYSCGGSRFRVPVSALAGHRRLTEE